MLISHFTVDEDWELSCCMWFTRQAFWQRVEKSHLCQWKQNKTEASVTINVAKYRETERKNIPSVCRQMRGEGWQGGWRGSDERPGGEERLMKWLQDRENTRRRRWMLEARICGTSKLCNHCTLISCYSTPILSPSGTLGTQKQTATLSTQEYEPDYLFCSVYNCKRKEKKKNSTRFKTSALAFLNHISLVKRDSTKKKKPSWRVGGNRGGLQFLWRFQTWSFSYHGGLRQSRQRSSFIISLISLVCVCACSKESMSSWMCGTAVIDNHSKYTALFTVYELCLPSMLTCLLWGEKKTNNSGW